MSANTFGEFFKIHTFGESHGAALGVVIDGVPSGIEFDEKLLLNFLDRRRPGQSSVVSARNEIDKPEILSGVHEGKTLGTPLAVIVRNQDARSDDYETIAQAPRAGHADDMWKSKFSHSDPRGGGRSSGRETLCRVIGGAVAQMFVQQLHPECCISAFAQQIGPFELTLDEIETAKKLSPLQVDQFVARYPSANFQKQVEELLLDAKKDGKSFGGRAQLVVHQIPKNLGRPVFHKLKSDLALACMSVGATSSFELGDGISATLTEGSQFHVQGEKPYGGIRGGISTGSPIELRVGFKPTSSVLDVAKKGRHDPCIVPRAIPVLEAMLWLVLADHLLAQRLDRL